MKLIPPTHRHERGTAVIAVMMILAVLGAFVAANGTALHSLRREIQLIEHQQQQRWAGVTNSAATLLQQDSANRAGAGTIKPE